MLLVQLIILQTIIFGVVIYALKKLLYGDTQSAVNRLNESYQEIAKKKEEMTAKIQQIEQEYQKRRDEAEKIGNQIRDKAEKEMYAKADALIKKAHQEAERIVVEAATAKDKLRAEIRKEEEINLTAFCEELLSQSLDEVMRDNVDDLIIDNFVKDLATTDMSHVPTGLTEIEIITRKPIRPEVREAVIKIVNEKLKENFTFKDTVDKDIIAGVIIKFGTLLLDGSVGGKIKEKALAKKQQIEARV